MNVETTKLPGVLLFRGDVHEDDRGFFAEIFRLSEFIDRGVETSFVQENLAGSKAGVLRGLHYQICHPQGKLVRVTRGALFDVAVDLRRSSTGFGKWEGFELSADDVTLLWLPVGCAHGYYVLSPWAEIQYKVTNYYDPSCERTLLWSDPAVGVSWPIPSGTQPSVSERDAHGMRFADIEHFE